MWDQYTSKKIGDKKDVITHFHSIDYNVHAQVSKMFHIEYMI